MNKFYLLIFGLFFVFPAWAANELEPLLNKVTLPLHAERWVTTKTALVDIGVNAAVSDQGIVQIQNEVLQKLNQFSNKGEWHVVSFNRQLDKSGLESIQITAQARLPQTELGNLRDKAKAISKPGETFTIDNVQFIPSEDEIRQANIELRNAIYQQAKAEIDALNKMYPDQKYYPHRIDFVMLPPVEPMPMAQNMMYGVRAASVGTVARTPLSVGNKVELQATVVLTSMPELLAQKLTHP